MVNYTQPCLNGNLLWIILLLHETNMRSPAINPLQLPQRPNPETYWVIPGRFLAGAFPASLDVSIAGRSLANFLKIGLDTFIDLTSEYERPDYSNALQVEAAEFGMNATHQHFSIRDGDLPSVEQMIRILNFIDSSLAAGHNLYLHCYGGIGRTGTVVGCHLVRHGLTGHQALERLTNLYATASQSRFYPYSPETIEQVQFILDWHET